MIILDFAKAFVTIKLVLNNKFFKFLNLGENFCYIIRILQNSAFSCYERSDFLFRHNSLNCPEDVGKGIQFFPTYL